MSKKYRIGYLVCFHDHGKYEVDNIYLKEMDANNRVRRLSEKTGKYGYWHTTEIKVFTDEK